MSNEGDEAFYSPTNYVWMDGWMGMDGRMDGRMDGCMHAWMYVCTYVRMYVCMCINIYIYISRKAGDQLGRASFEVASPLFSACFFSARFQCERM